MILVRLAPVVGYAACIVGANAAVQAFGFVPVGFGLSAPAGVYLAGLALWLRDLSQETLGRRAVVAAICAGALLSYWVSPAFALASAAAFLLSELADFAVYTPLRRRDLVLAVLASGLVGLVVDSMLFLQLAFGGQEHLAGQVVGKLWVTLLAAAVMFLTRALLRPRPAHG
jgi:hypothetical protein